MVGGGTVTFRNERGSCTFNTDTKLMTLKLRRDDLDWSDWTNTIPHQQIIPQQLQLPFDIHILYEKIKHCFDFVKECHLQGITSERVRHIITIFRQSDKIPSVERLLVHCNIFLKKMNNTTYPHVFTSLYASNNIKLRTSTGDAEITQENVEAFKTAIRANDWTNIRVGNWDVSTKLTQQTALRNWMFRTPYDTNYLQCTKATNEKEQHLQNVINIVSYVNTVIQRQQSNEETDSYIGTLVLVKVKEDYGASE